MKFYFKYNFVVNNRIEINKVENNGISKNE